MRSFTFPNYFQVIPFHPQLQLIISFGPHSSPSSPHSLTATPPPLLTIMSMSLLSTAIGARPVQQKIRLPFPRSKNGCLTCRKDRKKCDEQKSVCSRCRTYGRDCAWPLPKEMLTPSPTAWRRDPPSESEVQENEQEQEPQPLQTSPAPTIIQYLSSGELSPEEDEFISDIVGTEYGLGQIRQPIFSGALQDRDPVSSLFWHHFVSDVVDNLSTRTSTRNPVRKYILPMIETDEVLLDLMVALGGINLCSKLGTPNISVVTWTCYGKVIRTLRSKTCNSHLQSPDSTLRLLTALQLLICFEVSQCHQGSL